MDEEIKSVLIAGGAGYLGQVLSEKLLAEGMRVRVFDLFVHGPQNFSRIADNPNFSLTVGDALKIPDLREAALEVDAVVYLAAVVGDAAVAKDPELAVKLNRDAPILFRDRVSQLGTLKKFVFCSTDSCYGNRPGENLDEDSRLLPVSLYAKTKADAETRILASREAELREGIRGPATTVLRPGTAFGLSPRMRFDLVLNLLVREATLKKTFVVRSGEQWRPFVHARDIAEAFRLVLKAPRDLADGKVFNVGSDAMNVKFRDLGNLISETLDAKMTIEPGVPDLRDYRVNFGRIRSVLGFEARVSLREGILEIADALRRGVFPDPHSRAHVNA
ncbi:MAG: NAD(P)-dependent oxidoreductase [Deltaproteobacteria bacterium]|jgi:nucleoside-diphosphate-sugar epimerase|nr:NAD(P)-dependent oxidoreductase [Deltaproteobacteria bacterium]